MSLQRSILAFLLITTSVCQAQSSRLSVPNSSTGSMQPWLVGMAAVVGFLFIVFVILIVKRLLKRKREEEESSHENSSQMEYQRVNDMKQTSL